MRVATFRWFVGIELKYRKIPYEPPEIPNKQFLQEALE